MGTPLISAQLHPLHLLLANRELSVYIISDRRAYMLIFPVFFQEGAALLQGASRQRFMRIGGSRRIHEQRHLPGSITNPGTHCVLPVLDASRGRLHLALKLPTSTTQDTFDVRVIGFMPVLLASSPRWITIYHHLLVFVFPIPINEFLRGIGMGAGRTGLLDVLERMGGRIAVFNRRTTDAGEPVADLEVAHADLTASSIKATEVPSLVDELPILALAACCARGKTRVRGAEELRVKESDRLQSVRDALRRVGGHIEVEDDGWFIRGVPARLRGGTIDPRGDHRVAMLGAVAGAISREGVQIEGSECVGISFPGFFDLLDSVKG